MSGFDTQTGINRYLFLAEAAVWRYRAQGVFIQGLVRGKLRHDPVYRELLDPDILPAKGTLLHLGCGRGILLALLATATNLGLTARGKTIGGQPWLVGMELRQRHADMACAVLAEDAEIIAGDMCSEPFPPCRAVVLLDVLHYLKRDEQDRVMAKAAAALESGGVLVVRETRGGRVGRWVGNWLSRRADVLARDRWRQRWCLRSEAEWREALEALGLTVTSRSMGRLPLLGHLWFVARKG